MSIKQSWRELSTEDKEEFLEDYFSSVKKKLLSEDTLSLNVSVEHEPPEEIRDGFGKPIRVSQVLNSKIIFEYDHINK